MSLALARAGILFQNTLNARLAKISRATHLDVYVRRSPDEDGWLMACADEETEFGIRPAATAAGTSEVAVVDHLLAKLGYCEDEDGNVVRIPHAAPAEAGTVRLGEIGE